MGAYTTNTLDNEQFKKIIYTIRNGYTDSHGTPHRPNNQIANILVLEANLGCRIGDIVNLTTESFIYDGGIWKINIVEQKTDKTRTFIVSKPIKNFIDAISPKSGKLFDVKSPAVWKALRQVTEYLGYEKISSHSFRKKAANDIYEATGHDIELVCAYLNHSDTRITRRYLRRSDAQLEAAITNVINIA